jgi:5-methylcytosine-specific restriction endonuclease McrA
LDDPLRRLLDELAQRERHDPRDERVRTAVAGRARGACEYCLLPTGGQFQIDHIVPPARWEVYAARRLRGAWPAPARGGPDHLDNFAWSCPFCNGRKGQQVSRTVNRRTVRLFDPRHDDWPEHFVLVQHHLLYYIVGLTAVGEATARALDFNDGRPWGPLGARHGAAVIGRYPPYWARGWSIALAP